MTSIAAIVPMRHHSERVPQKNYRSFSGRPLYHCIIDTLLSCRRINQIIIDTDSPTICEDAAEHFPSVRLLERPNHLRADTIAMNDVLLNTVKHCAADFYLQTHSTNPLLKAETIERAIRELLSSGSTHDSLFSVTRRQVRLWDGDAKPINHDPSILMRTQDLPPFYEENSCIYIFTRQSLVANKNRIGARPLMFEIDAEEAGDIDDLHDFERAETLYMHLRSKQI